MSLFTYGVNNMSVTGFSGQKFDIVEYVETSTGEISQQHKTPDAINNLTISEDDLVYSIYGSVGTTAFDFDFTDINNQSGSGYSTQVVRNNDGDLSGVKSFVLYNTSENNNLILGSASTNNAFSWLDVDNGLIIPPGASFMLVFPDPLTIDSTHKLISIDASSASTTFLMYILGE